MLWIESLKARLRSSSSITPCLRRSLEIGGASRTSSSVKEDSSTRRKSRSAEKRKKSPKNMHPTYYANIPFIPDLNSSILHRHAVIRRIHITMMPGSITSAWWRMMPTQTQSEKFMNEPSPTSPRSRRRDTGRDISICGSTTLCTRS